MAEHRAETRADAASEAVATEAAFHLPAPTVWPITLAGGITLLVFGIITTYLFSLAGLALIALAVHGWIGDLDDAHR